MSKPVDRLITQTITNVVVKLFLLFSYRLKGSLVHTNFIFTQCKEEKFVSGFVFFTITMVLLVAVRTDVLFFRYILRH